MKVLNVLNWSEERLDDIVAQSDAGELDEYAQAFVVGQLICLGLWGTELSDSDIEVASWIVVDDTVRDGEVLLRSDELFHTSRATLERRAGKREVCVFDDTTGEFLVEMALGSTTEPFRASRETPLATGLMPHVGGISRRG